jgi:ubiquinone/menaquinone biosynthesis C-methylase UbiE
VRLRERQSIHNEEVGLTRPIPRVSGTAVTFPFANAASAGVCASVPAYLKETYAWAYLNPRALAFFDRPWVVSAILFGNYRRLQRALLRELKPGMQVLQAACVYGDFSRNLAKRVGMDGKLDVIDVAGLQIANCKRKLRDFPQACAWVADAAAPRTDLYDAVCCFFLLHELPDDYKRTVVDALLASVRPGGSVVFVDYHKPHFANPLKLVLNLVFDTLEPYAKALWGSDIAALASAPEKFTWHKQTFFGGVYQKVVARRRSSDELRL